MELSYTGLEGLELFTDMDSASGADFENLAESLGISQDTQTSAPLNLEEIMGGSKDSNEEASFITAIANGLKMDCELPFLSQAETEEFLLSQSLSL